MGKFPEIILKLQFLFLEWPQHEVSENQGRPTFHFFFLPLVLLIFMLTNFSLVTKLFLFVPLEEDL